MVDFGSRSKLYTNTIVYELIFVRPLDFRDCAPPLEKLIKGIGYLFRVPKDPC